jgi:hypothetical protein
MTGETLNGHLGTAVTIDVCLPCRMFWFDGRESLQLAPAATLKLFRIVGEETDGARAVMAAKPACPRCGARLLLTNDRQRNTAFRYMRCPKGHGRLVSFLDFLREKDFVRPLSGAQIKELRDSVQTVNCSNCGAPIDLNKETACTHCGSPLSMIDMKQAAQLIGQLQEAAAPRPVDSTLALRLEAARREVEASFSSVADGGGAFEGAASKGLIGASLSALLRLLD